MTDEDWSPVDEILLESAYDDITDILLLVRENHGLRGVKKVYSMLTWRWDLNDD